MSILKEIFTLNFLKGDHDEETEQSCRLTNINIVQKYWINQFKSSPTFV